MQVEETIPAWLEGCFDKPVAVLGAGVTGRAVEAWLKKLGASGVLYDESPGEGVVEAFDADRAAEHLLGVVSPGFNEGHPWLETARAAGMQLVAEVDLGAAFWKGPLIAVTGTNGKTTLVEFLSFAFQSYGVEARALGNVGEPICAALAKDCNREAVAVCEVSSFQAAALRYLRADYVLWTNFAEDHMDRHGTLRRYFESKYKLVSLSGEKALIYGEGVSESAMAFGISLPEEGMVAEAGSPEELGISGTAFSTQPELRNYLMARALWRRMGMSESELIEAAHAFKKSPHRMELVRSIEGRVFWDDSKATNFHAVYGGLQRFEEPVIWIGGGKDKGGDIPSFARRIAGRIERAILIGETAPALEMSLRSQGVECALQETLQEAVELAFAKAAPGQHILLSPGFASFDMFNGYAHRGEEYRRAVSALAGEE